jgi:hypothetical protein
VNKDKRSRFLEVAPKRVVVALRAIERVGRCGKRNLYEFDHFEREAIFDALTKALLDARAEFEPPQKPERTAPTFELPAPGAFSGED